MGKARLTSLDFDMAANTMSQAGINHTITNRLFTVWKNNVPFESKVGYPIDVSIPLSSAKVSDTFGLKSATSGGKLKEDWHGMNMILINGRKYDECIFEEDGVVRRSGSKEAHEISFTPEFMEFLETKDPKKLEAILQPVKSYELRTRRKRALGRKNSARHTNRDLLSDEERKASLYRRSEKYVSQTKRLSVHCEQKNENQNSWKNSFVQDLNVFGLQLALEKLKEKMKLASRARNDWSIGVVNILKQQGKESDITHALNFIYNQLYIKLDQGVCEAINSGSLEKIGAAVKLLVSEIFESTIPRTIIEKAFSHWVNQRNYPADVKNHMISMCKYIDINPLNSEDNFSSLHKLTKPKKPLNLRGSKKQFEPPEPPPPKDPHKIESSKDPRNQPGYEPYFFNKKKNQDKFIAFDEDLEKFGGSYDLEGVI